MAIVEHCYSRVAGEVESKGRIARYLDRQYEARSEKIKREIGDHLGAVNQASREAYAIVPESAALVSPV